MYYSETIAQAKKQLAKTNDPAIRSLLRKFERHIAKINKK